MALGGDVVDITVTDRHTCGKSREECDFFSSQITSIICERVSKLTNANVGNLSMFCLPHCDHQRAEIDHFELSMECCQSMNVCSRAGDDSGKATS